MPASIAPIALFDRNMTAPATATDRASRQPFCARMLATSAAITDTESPSKNRSILGDMEIRRISNGPMIRVPQVTKAMRAIAKRAVVSFSMANHGNEATGQSAKNDVPTHG